MALIEIRLKVEGPFWAGSSMRGTSQLPVRPSDSAFLTFHWHNGRRPLWTKRVGFGLMAFRPAGVSLVVRQGFNAVTRHVVPSEKDEDCSRPGMLRVCRNGCDSVSGQPIPSFNVVLRGSIMGRHAADRGTI